MENVKNIGMKCNQKQFEKIKPKLEKHGRIVDVKSSFKKCGYLVNNYCYNGQISNITGKYTLADYDYIQDWNEKVFLEACGIFEDPKFEITKETIYKYQMKDEFPEVFETVFKTGYYKHKNREYPEWFTYVDFETREYYSRGALGDWFQGNAEYHLKYIVSNCEPMSTEEVTEALKKEAVKRYKVGDCSICLHHGIYSKIDLEYKTALDEIGFWYGGKCVMKDGKWAEIIPTKTIQEAEELLKCKIV